MGGVSFHSVRSGDTLSKIARDNNMTLNQLLEANPQFRANPNKIQVGQKVNIPSVFTAKKQGTNGTRGVGQQATANSNNTRVNPDGSYTTRKDLGRGSYVETTYDANGNKESETSYVGGKKQSTTEYENGKRKSITEYNSNGKATRKEEYAYNSQGQGTGMKVTINPKEDGGNVQPGANPDHEKSKGFLASLPAIGHLFS